MELSGPMFEQDSKLFKSVNSKIGSHYNIYSVTHGMEMEALKLIFPDGEANDLNFILFSTSGVHGNYSTIEEIEECLKKYGDDYEPKDDDDYSVHLTGLIIQPRLVCMRYFGEMRVKLKDISFLKKLRDSSFKQILNIGI